MQRHVSGVAAKTIIAWRATVDWMSSLMWWRAYDDDNEDESHNGFDPTGADYVVRSQRK